MRSEELGVKSEELGVRKLFKIDNPRKILNSCGDYFIVVCVAYSVQLSCPYGSPLNLHCMYGRTAW